MGNRAVIATKNKDLAVYLHWNGGRDSVNAFLTYCKMREFRCPEKDCYGWARLCQIIANFFGGELSIGIDTFENLDSDFNDNGTYIIENWEIVDRLHFPYEEQMEYDLLDLLEEIDNAQPKKDRLGIDKIIELLTEYNRPIFRK